MFGNENKLLNLIENRIVLVWPIVFRECFSNFRHVNHLFELWSSDKLKGGMNNLVETYIFIELAGQCIS